MCDTPFKTPLPIRTPRTNGDNGYCTPRRIHSDSDESTASNSDNNPGSTQTQTSNEDISIVAEFDDLMRFNRKLVLDKLNTEAAFLNLGEQTKKLHEVYTQAIAECKRLQNVLDAETRKSSDLEIKLAKARKLIDLEKNNTRNMRRERDDLAIQIERVRELLFRDKGTSRLPDEMRHKLSFLHNNNNSQTEWEYNGNYNNGQLSAIKEVNSTGSILSDFSYSRSEDDLDNSLLHGQVGKTWKKHRPSSEGVAEPAVKKRKSSTHKTVEISASETVRATTTLTVTKEGPITATSVIESVPKTCTATGSSTTITNVESIPSAPPAHLVFDSWARDSPRRPETTISTRQHCLQQKTIVMPDTCGPCDKRIRFGKTALRCKDCKAICHVECKDNLPLTCVPAMHTPNQRNTLGVIGDYTPITPPMVPAILIHCINEIELRGLNEIGIYRVPGAERDVKALKEKFLHGRGTPSLNQVDVHVICGVVKDFLRNLNEPLITYKLWKKFVSAAEARDRSTITTNLCQLLSELPQPNRDTMAYLILHLQKVAESKECKMNISNLAKVFGPTIVGYSSDNPNPSDLLNEIVLHNNVMESLLNIPREFWTPFVNIVETAPLSKLQQTPSTDSLLPHSQRSFFTPTSRLALTKRRQKYFASPKQ